MAVATKNFIVDASVIISHLLEENTNDQKISLYLDHFYDKKVNFSSPTLLKAEVGNSLKSALLSHRIDVEKAYLLLKYFTKLPIKYIDPNPQLVLKIAIDTKHSFYDATYLALSKETGYPLLTLDKALAKLA